MSVASRTNFVHYACMKEDALVQFKLMLPAGLKKRVEESASANRRTLSQEIVAILERAFPSAQDRVRMSHALADLAQLVEEFEGEEREALMPLVRKKIDDELNTLEQLRTALESKRDDD